MDDIFDLPTNNDNLNSANNIHHKETTSKLGFLARVSEPDARNMQSIEKVSAVEEPDSFKLLRTYHARLNEYTNKGGEASAMYGTVRTFCKKCHAGKCPKHADNKNRRHSKYFKNLQRRPAKLSKERKLARAALAALRDARRAESGPPPLHPISTGDAAKDEELERAYAQKLAKWDLWHDVTSGRKKLD